jgi:Tripartite tricarboxylate transporter TctB family
MSDTKSNVAMPAGKVNLIILGLLLVFFTVLFIMSRILGGTAGRVPGIISGFGFVLTMIEIFAQVRTMVNKTAKEEAAEPAMGLKWYYSLVMVLSYLVILMLFGFIISNLIYLFLCPVLLGYRKWHVNLVFTLVATVISYYCFVQLFMVQLPEGIVIAKLLGR